MEVMQISLFHPRTTLNPIQKSLSIGLGVLDIHLRILTIRTLEVNTSSI